jgi:CubicO group peptidase (beta-lactamase class C family)
MKKKEKSIWRYFFCRRLIFLMISVLVISCSTETSMEIDITPLQLNDGWKISTPEAQGMSSSELIEAFEKASDMSFLYSIIVVRNGFLVAEKYYNGASVDQAKYVASVTKSYLSALIGIALDKGIIQSLDQKMISFFPEYDSIDIEPAKYEITLRQLLQMRAGYWHDSETSRWLAWVNSPDWIEYMINLPLENPPGIQWNYSTGSSHILSAILTKTSGMSGEDFARHYLFEPLDTELVNWGEDQQGYNYGGFDMHITPRDMARFGLLFLNKGQYKGQQIVPEDWIWKSTSAYSDVSWFFGVIQNPQYGYHWWIGKMEGHDIFFAQGHGGQNIIVFPGLEMVVVTATNPDLGFEDSWLQSIAIFHFIAKDILVAVKE